MSQVALNTEDVALLLSVACEVEDRSRPEQKAMLTAAERLDRVIFKHSTHSPLWRAFEVEGGDWPDDEHEWERLVHESGGSEGRPVVPSWERDPAAYAKRQRARAAEVEEVRAGRVA